MAITAIINWLATQGLMSYNGNVMSLTNFNDIVLRKKRVQLNWCTWRDDSACQQYAFCLGDAEVRESNRASFAAVH
jgi:hypothetical protein